MSQLTVKVLQLALLALLWVFVISVVGVLRRDLFGTRATLRADGTGRQAAVPDVPPPAPHRQAPAVPLPAPAVLPPPAPLPPTPAPARPAVARPEEVRRPPAAPGVVGSRAPHSLVVTEGPVAGTSVPLGATAVVLGRAPDCTLVLPDDYASSHHARFVPRGGRWVLEDLGSTNGTLLGREAPVPVRGSVDVGVGSVVRIGRSSIELR